MPQNTYPANVLGSPELHQDSLDLEDEPSLMEEETPEDQPEATDDPFSLRTRTKPSHTASQQALETVPLRTYEELSSKHKILEARHSELRVRLTELQGMKEEHASLLAAKPKFQNKILELSEQVKELKGALKEAEVSKDSVEDMQSQMELLMVDKEMAEEQLDQANIQMSDLKERMAEQEVETQVLKEALANWEAKLDGPTDDSGKGSAESSNLKVIQLERQNDRLKEALARSVSLLHDVHL